MPKIYKTQDGFDTIIEGYNNFPSNTLSVSNPSGDLIQINDASGNEIDTFHFSEILNSSGAPAGTDLASVMSYLSPEIVHNISDADDVSAQITSAISIPNNQIVTGNNAGDGISSANNLTFDETSGFFHVQKGTASESATVRVNNNSLVQFSSAKLEFQIDNVDPLSAKRVTFKYEKSLPGVAGEGRLILRKDDPSSGFIDYLRIGDNNQIRFNGAINGTGQTYGNVVVENGNLVVNNTVSILGGNPGAGKVLQSDASGNATWETPTSSGDPDQNIYETVAGDTGSVAASTANDTLTIAGGTNITTEVVGGNLVINAPPVQNIINVAGRVYLYADERWITLNDDNYSSGYYQFQESAGTGSDPIIEWEHQGWYMPAGAIVKQVVVVGRYNSSHYTDINVSFQEVAPNPVTRWESGIDSDGELTTTEITRDLFMNHSAGPAFTGPFTTDRRRRVFPINHTFTQDSEFRIYISPVGSSTSTGYFPSSYLIYVEYPQVT